MDHGQVDLAVTDRINAQIESFLEHLKAKGYSKRTLAKKRSSVWAFERWVKNEYLTLDCVSDRQTVAKFLGRLPPTRIDRIDLERVTLRLLQEFLKPAREGAQSHGSLMDRYRDYLQNSRGLAKNSLLVYLPRIRDFLAYSGTAEHADAFPPEHDATLVRTFLVEHTVNRSPGHAHLLAAALRSFFRFLFCQGYSKFDLSLAVPTVRGRSRSLPPSLSYEDVESILASPDTATAGGRRDHAILLLLARLGLRAGEVVGLELEDIRWRAGEIVVRGKGRQRDRLPLVSDVGEALALYLQGRGETSSRRVFLRLHAPRAGLAGPAAVGHIVRRAFAKSGLRRPGRVAAHMFRHGLATRMIQHGASMPEISEVLRHRALSSTEVYAQVSFEALRQVARNWPIEVAQ